MISGRRKRATLGVGHDAFLDIVANLVGVLIILIAVFSGSSSAMVQQAQQKVREELLEKPDLIQASDTQVSELAKLASRAARAHDDSDHLENQVDQFDMEIELRKQERSALLDLHYMASTAWEEKRSELNQTKIEAARRQTELDRATEQLEELQGEKQRLKTLPDAVVALQHLPTPMAKKVYEDRIVLRLRNDHVSVVPGNALMKLISSHVRRSISGSRRPKQTDVVGPIRDYTARYSLVVGQTSAQFHGAIFQPTHEPIGQRIEQVVAGQSEIESELAGRDPNSTSILVWVYPDSYRSLRTLKEYLYAKGYATAVRPRETHEPIGISVLGTDSNPQ
jgi:hypothetical protein